MWGPEASVLLSLENSKLFLCPVYLIDSQHLSGSQSISLSPLLHHSHFWQLNTRSKASVTRMLDTGTHVTATLGAAALQAKPKRAPVPGQQPVSSKAEQAEGTGQQKEFVLNKEEE